MINGRALEVLPRLTDGAYDLVFVDAAKEEYLQYVPEAIRLLRDGGILVVDNALWHDRVADPTQRDAETVAVRETGPADPGRRDAGTGTDSARRRPARCGEARAMRARSTGWLLVAGSGYWRPPARPRPALRSPVATPRVTLTSVVPPSGTVPPPPLRFADDLVRTGDHGVDAPTTVQHRPGRPTPSIETVDRRGPAAASTGPSTESTAPGPQRPNRRQAAPSDEPQADPDTPGPDAGPTCTADPQYVNEPTTGLRRTSRPGWRKAVAKAKAPASRSA